MTTDKSGRGGNRPRSGANYRDHQHGRPGKRGPSGGRRDGHGQTQRDKANRPARAQAPPTISGLEARGLALHLLEAVLVRKRGFDDVLAHALSLPAFKDLSSRDKAFARLLSATVLRRHGQLSALCDTFLEKPLPADASRVRLILLMGAAQLVFLDAPAHAAIHTAVELCRGDRRSARFRGLVNAVLRRVSERGAEIAAGQDAVADNVPGWLLARWEAAYGHDLARQIAEASLKEAPLDITPKADAADWAARLDGRLLPSGSIRVATGGRIEELPGYAEGAWWVQDAAAALPARLFGNIAGRKIADLCAAPGGKTAQLIAAGAEVTAVDHSESRLAQLCANLKRLELTAKTQLADIGTWQPAAEFDGFLLDAPCSATGTIRRHPDIPHLKTADDITTLAEVQARLLAHVADLMKPGATLIYCTCSLEPEEGPDQVARLLAARSDLARQPISADEVGGLEALVTTAGDMWSLPCHAPGGEGVAIGMDGFFAARLVKQG